MAVFTVVDDDTLKHWLDQYTLGAPVALRGIPSGIENSNYFLTTTRGEYVLTVFEKLGAHELPFYLELMRHLAARDVPVPDPMPRRNGALFGMLHGKPAAIVTRLQGSPRLAPAAPHCAEVGRTLARLHLAGRDFPLSQPNLRSLPWWRETAPVVLSFLDEPRRGLLRAELRHQERFFGSREYAALPGGPCHCDLFRDNVLFVDASDAGNAGNAARDRLGGVFDFYFAGCDKWLFDLAVTVNDWCVEAATGGLDAARADALLHAYQDVRPLDATERAHWHDMLRAAALRFWMSRLYDFHLPRKAEMLTPHDPGHFERILRERIAAVIPASGHDD
jgi:homoserine kinase type II